VGDGGRRDKAILHMLCVLDGLLDVLVKGVKLVKFLLNFVSSHGWLGLSTQPTPREVDRKIGKDEVSNCELGGVEKVKALVANGDVSGSRVEKLALEAMEYDEQGMGHKEGCL
ncbi:hypothetical protein Tco_1203617, partial [Tanacetum coccineum]